VIVEKSYSSTTTGHFGVTTHLTPQRHRCIQAKRLPWELLVAIDGDRDVAQRFLLAINLT
jgi:hypothetical protein